MSRPAPFVHRRIVAFSETDSAGIVHFAELFRYMEDCEHALLRSIGRTVHESGEAGSFVGFPRVSAHASFLRPLRFEDEVEVRAWVVHLGRSSIRYRFEIVGVADGGTAAVGETVVVRSRREGGVLSSLALDGPLRESLGTWLEPEAGC